MIGASHRRKGTPNQDAIDSFAIDGAYGVAVADGHGSEAHGLSHIGSQAAVQVLLSLFRELDTLLRQELSDTLSHEVSENLKNSNMALHLVIKDWLQSLPRNIVKRWRYSIDQYIAQFQSEEPQLKGFSSADASLQSLHRYKPFGTTLLGVFVTQYACIYVQLGDGDIVQVFHGQKARPVFEPQKELIANETYSLSQSHPDLHVLSKVELFDRQQSPDFIFLATDGYSNSFATTQKFMVAVEDFHSTLRAHELEKVEHYLPVWLEETTTQGSGDDISVALVLCGEHVRTDLSARLI